MILACTGCMEDHAGEPLLVNERSGMLMGVRFGDTEEEVRAHLGEPTDDHDGVFPEGADYTGPTSIPVPASDRGRGAPQPLHYGDTAFLVSRTVGVFAIVALADNARTVAGVEIGDDLDRVREAYERVECGEAVSGEPLFGGDTPMYPWCRVRGNVHIFFGDDPIDSITLSTTPARG